MGHDYVSNYLQAIENPLPELRLTLKAEFDFFKSHIKPHYKVLDVGCGAGRPADVLASLCKHIACIDNDPAMLVEAKKRCAHIDNVSFQEGDALNMSFESNAFDLTFATYNLIGDIAKDDRQKLVHEMLRVTKPDCKVINLTWKDDKTTTAFLKKYYPAIGIEISQIDEAKTITSKGVFYRVTKNELLEYYEKAGLKKIEFFDIGQVWLAILGEK